MEKEVENKIVPTVPADNALGTVAQSPEEYLSEVFADADGLHLEFMKINTPTAGGTIFEIEDPTTGTTAPMKTLDCVILKSFPSNVMYLDDYDGTAVPPDCSSNDGVIGVDKDGNEHECAKCTYNQFGSGKNGGKACKNRRLLYVLLDGEQIPRVINLPSTSLSNLAKFQTQVLMARKRLRDYRVLISLTKATSKTNIPYSNYVFATAGLLENPEDIARVNDAMALLAALGK